MDLQYIFSQKYLFDPTPPPESKLYLRLLIFFSILIIAAITILLIKRLEKKARERQFYCFLVCGVLGMFYLFGRYEGLPWLGSRFFLVLILLTLLAWTFYLAIWMARYLPEKKYIEQTEERYKKYLPKSKFKKKEKIK